MIYASPIGCILGICACRGRTFGHGHTDRADVTATQNTGRLSITILLAMFGCTKPSIASDAGLHFSMIVPKYCAMSVMARCCRR